MSILLFGQCRGVGVPANAGSRVVLVRGNAGRCLGAGVVTCAGWCRCRVPGWCWWLVPVGCRVRVVPGGAGWCAPGGARYSCVLRYTKCEDRTQVPVGAG
jgi:hypothetical protein